MSTFEEHEAEQAAITAMCEAGTCDHPECIEDRHQNELVDRCAPRWAWDIIDEIMGMAPGNPRPGIDVDSEGDLIIEGPEGHPNMVRAMYLANLAMQTACERADDEPISRSQIDNLME